jgi:hypothetical protein
MTADDKPRLAIITDERDELTEQLVEAAQARGIIATLVMVDAFDHVEPPLLDVGDMLYRVATSHAAHVVEQTLAHPGVATCYVDELGPHQIWDNQSLLLARCGVPTPRTFYAMTTRRGELKRRVEALGGLPVILKVPGRSLGVGVVRVEAWPTLFSVADALYSAHGQDVHMMSCVEPAEHWRAIVVGEQVAASYRHVLLEDDFRTGVDEEAREHFEDEPPAGVNEVAVEACRALGLAFGGVDVLVHESGRVYVLEVNFPCYFGHPKRAVGLDVAGVLVEWLREEGARRRAAWRAAGLLA